MSYMLSWNTINFEVWNYVEYGIHITVDNSIICNNKIHWCLSYHFEKNDVDL